MRTKKKADAGAPAGGERPPVPEETGEEGAAPHETGGSVPAGFPVVGIGASAGGLAAFEQFFSGMPPDTDPGMAFVLVQHLAPNHKSILVDLIQRYTRMQVFEVRDGVAVRPNCAYIIPPNRDMAFVDGTLQLLEPHFPRGQRMPIDFFFRSLALDQHERAICVVLSGSGSDGTLGLRAVKGEGGMVMAQTPETAEYDGMPRSALATGLVDYELPPAHMPAQIIAYVTHAPGSRPGAATAPPPKVENALKKICTLLRAQTRHNFSEYKPSTIHRRTERRMAVHQIESLEGYVGYLRQNPAEVEALFRDLLIGVTSFFRDPEAFRALEEEVLSRLFAGRPAGSAIRVWVPGCSTGEEAYSLAILLSERQEALKRSFPIQVFATDIDRQAIATARAGLYPASISADLSPERLARFFSVEPDGSACRIHKAVRDLLVFSEQDLLTDPPFSRLDLISCRNLLIYLNGEVQKKLVPLFHYSLNPGGILFLGPSETVGEFGDLFATLDRKHKLYARRDAARSAPPAPLPPAPLAAADERIPRPGKETTLPRKPSLRELTEKTLLERVFPTAALVKANGDILYLHGRTGLYLEPAPGEAGQQNLLKMARQGLQNELTAALRKAATGRETVRVANLRVKTNGESAAVHATVCPAAAGPESGTQAPLFLVVLEPSTAAEPAAGPAAPRGGDADASLARLQQELRAKEEYLQTSNEELETANEELKSSNEELQSVNEELQSTNEELETSKEELQSLNEELATVNAELQSKVADLTRINNDMNNLLAGTGIATVYVDHGQRILRFTPAATRIMNLIQGDVGRPVGHLAPNLAGYDRLSEDTREVLDTLVPREVEVKTSAGNWYAMRIAPYRTLDNAIEGAVITFVDIDSMKHTEEALRDHEAVYHALVTASGDAVYRMNADWSEMRHLRGRNFIPDTETPSRTWLERYIHPDDRQEVRNAVEQAVRTRSVLELEHRVLRVDGTPGWTFSRAVPVLSAAGEVVEWVGTARDITAFRDRRVLEDGNRPGSVKDPPREPPQEGTASGAREKTG